ncbi:hypothetical protein JXJ21_26725 [candidate division KSB1 bacterium]|nr:hypothetical protein [candidate division KSB1 bacterium]
MRPITFELSTTLEYFKPYSTRLTLHDFKAISMGKKLPGVRRNKNEHKIQQLSAERNQAKILGEGLDEDHPKADLRIAFLPFECFFTSILAII